MDLEELLFGGGGKSKKKSGGGGGIAFDLANQERGVPQVYKVHWNSQSKVWEVSVAPAGQGGIGSDLASFDYKKEAWKWAKDRAGYKDNVKVYTKEESPPGPDPASTEGTWIA